MSAIIRPRSTRLGQPTGPVEINWAHPWAKNLRAFCLAHVGGVTELVSGRPFEQFGESEIVAGQDGPACNAFGTSGSWKLEFLPDLCSVTDDISVVSSFWSNEPMLSGGVQRRFLHYYNWDGTTGLSTFSSFSSTGATNVLQTFLQKAGGTFNQWYSPIGGLIQGEQATWGHCVPAISATNSLRLLSKNGATVTSASFAGTSTNNLVAPVNAIYLGGTRIGASPCFGGVRFSIFFNTYLGQEALNALTANPWQLLKPIHHRIWFDVGGAVSSPYSWTGAALSQISTAVGQAQDARAAVSTTQALTHDATAAISLVYDLRQSALAGVSSDYLILHDARAAISEQVGYSVTHDALARVSEAVTLAQAGSAAVSSTVLVVQDAQAAVSEGVEYTVSLDAVAQISTALVIRQDAITAVSSTVRQIMDAAAGVSAGYVIVHDGRAIIVEGEPPDSRAVVTLTSAGQDRLHVLSAGTLRVALQSRSKITIFKLGGEK